MPDISDSVPLKPKSIEVLRRSIALISLQETQVTLFSERLLHRANLVIHVLE